MNDHRKGRCPRMNQKQFLLTLLLAIISGSLGGALSVWFLMPPSVLAQDEVPKVIEAQQFKVVDKDGKAGAILGNGGLWLSGLRGGSILLADSLKIANLASESAVEIFADEDGAGLRISNENRMIADLLVDEDGNPRFQLYDSKGDVRTVLGSTRLKNTSTGSTEMRAPSSLVLFNEEGDVVWSAP